MENIAKYQTISKKDLEENGKVELQMKTKAKLTILPTKSDKRIYLEFIQLPDDELDTCCLWEQNTHSTPLHYSVHSAFKSFQTKDL